MNAAARQTSVSDPYLAPRRRRSIASHVSKSGTGGYGFAELARGEQTSDPYVSGVIQAGNYVGGRAQTLAETEAQKSRHRLGLDGTNPWKRSGIFRL